MKHMKENTTSKKTGWIKWKVSYLFVETAETLRVCAATSSLLRK